MLFIVIFSKLYSFLLPLFFSYLIAFVNFSHHNGALRLKALDTLTVTGSNPPTSPCSCDTYDCWFSRSTGGSVRGFLNKILPTSKYVNTKIEKGRRLKFQLTRTDKACLGAIIALHLVQTIFCRQLYSPLQKGNII